MCVCRTPIWWRTEPCAAVSEWENKKSEEKNNNVIMVGRRTFIWLLCLRLFIDRMPKRWPTVQSDPVFSVRSASDNITKIVWNPTDGYLMWCDKFAVLGHFRPGFLSLALPAQPKMEFVKIFVFTWFIQDLTRIHACKICTIHRATRDRRTLPPRYATLTNVNEKEKKEKKKEKLLLLWMTLCLVIPCRIRPTISTMSFRMGRGAGQSRLANLYAKTTFS